MPHGSRLELDQIPTGKKIRAFLSINILMGIEQLPQVEMYWSTNPL
jgi:hypothetical protein